MPPRDGISDLVRLVRGVRGRVELRTEIILRFDYGAVVPWVERLEEGGGLRAIAGPDEVVLRTPCAPRPGLHDRRRVRCRPGDVVPFVLSYGPSHQPPPRTIDAERALRDTEAFWRTWSDRCAPAGPWTEAVKRSPTVLKGLTYAPTGGIVAAPTTSLPEQAGGVRNWDYRCCWLRDATFTLIALGTAGYYDEARDWRDWLVRAVAGRPDQLQIMYGVGGERRLTEWEVPWLLRVRRARPVRIGNAAAAQLQLDVYGEVADALFQARLHGLPSHRRGRRSRAPSTSMSRPFGASLTRDLGSARPRQHFTHSKVMAWVALDRAVKSVEELGVTGPVDRWRAVRNEIHADVCRQGFDPELGSFVQAYGSKALDASLLLLLIVGFLPPTDPRIVGTVRAIERRLMMDAGLPLRHGES